MADLSKLAAQLNAQRAAKAAAIEQAPSPTPAATPAPAPAPPVAAAPAAAAPASTRRGRKPSTDSKRQGWIARTYYLRPETAVRLKRYVLQAQIEGGAVVDGSEVVDAALAVWLDRAEKST
jgi:hypothetical protein